MSLPSEDPLAAALQALPAPRVPAALAGTVEAEALDAFREAHAARARPSAWRLLAVAAVVFLYGGWALSAAGGVYR